MKTIDILGEEQYKVLLSILTPYVDPTSNNIDALESNPYEVVTWIKNIIIEIDHSTAEIKKILNDRGSVNLEDLNKLFNSKRELLRIKDALDDAIDSMRVQAMDLINQIEQLS
jgi:hypothetical protein